MGNFLSATWLLMATHISASLRGRRFWICLLLGLVPPGLALAAAGEHDAIRVAGPIALIFILQIFGPIIGLVLGSEVVTEEIENRTLSFVFTRPVPRAALLLGRYAATVLLVAMILVPSCLLVVYATSKPREGDATARLEVRIEVDRGQGDWRSEKTLRDRNHYRWVDEDENYQHAYVGRMELDEIRMIGSDIDGNPLRAVGKKHIPLERELPAGFSMRLVAAAVLAGALYTLVTAGFGTFLKRPMIYGLGYAFAMEFIIANVPGSAQSLSLQYYLRGILVGDGVESFRRFPPIRDTEFLTPLASATQLGVILGIGLCLASWIISRRQYVLTS